MRTVLLPVDFSDDNPLILAFARGLPSLGVRHVILGHVVEASGLEGPLIARKVDEARDQLLKHASELSAAGLSVEVQVVTGDPVEELSALAAETHVDAAVYGSHAKSVAGQLFVGSVSDRLMREATIPHLVVRFDLLRNQADPAVLLRRFGEKLVLATDFSLSAAHAFTFTVDLPPGAVKHLTLLHAIDPALTGEKLRRAEEGAEFHLKNLQAMCTQQKMPSSVSIRVDTPVHAVLDEIGERRASGVIVGTRGRNAVQEMLMGSVSMTLMRQASCPVLIVP
ncbi:universal stress protein [Anaerosoma tenue]|uniref:universal stress protein n=1 Tax=Anaerosoma tenue TaxID=2933588 RepID=UPI002260F4BE|nr:universal stress protein [Anaerosoma tenue]MCK8114338.1 universal stress protein [Anaerosoma tenue]